MRLKLARQVSMVVVALVAAPLHAQLTSPHVGWQTPLSRLAHNVSGTVTIVDDNSLRVDDFTYDGGGLSVYFYLGMQETQPAFAAGLQIGPQLLGQVFTGSQPPLMIDLPPGQTIQGWNAVTVWCVDVGVSFGQGTFAAVGPPGDYDVDDDVDGADFLRWQRGQSPQPLSAADLAAWRTNFGDAGASAGASFDSADAVPEPAASWLVAWAASAVCRRRRVPCPRPRGHAR